MCFIWSILAQLHPAENKNPQRVNQYEKYLNTLKYDGIEMPMSVGDINRFEKLNQDLTINVFAYEEGIVFPRRISERRGEKLINLIMFDNLKNGYHYVLTKNFDKLLGSRYAHQRKFCPYCCHGIKIEGYSPEKIKEHMDTCFTYGGAKIVMPEEGKNDKLKFKDYSKQLEAPF